MVNSCTVRGDTINLSGCHESQLPYSGRGHNESPLPNTSTKNKYLILFFSSSSSLHTDAPPMRGEDTTLLQKEIELQNQTNNIIISAACIFMYILHLYMNTNNSSFTIFIFIFTQFNIWPQKRYNFT